MYKRVEKRKRRQEEEEALGLDSEMKEILGVHDTDSDESQSSDNSDSEDEDEDSELRGTEEEDNDLLELGESYRSSDEDELANDLTLSSPTRALLAADEDDMDMDEDDEDDDDVGGDEPALTVEEALVDPFYAVTQPTDAWACILCPGKLLKTMVIRDTHAGSEAHKRRAQRFASAASNADPQSHACLISVSSALAPLDESTSGESKRAQKRNARRTDLASRRLRHKEKSLKKKKLPVQSQNSILSQSTAANADDEPSPQKLGDVAKKVKDKSSAKKSKVDSAKKVPTPTTEKEQSTSPSKPSKKSKKSKANAPNPTEDDPPPSKKRKTLPAASSASDSAMQVDGKTNSAKGKKKQNDLEGGAAEDEKPMKDEKPVKRLGKSARGNGPRVGGPGQALPSQANVVKAKLKDKAKDEARAKAKSDAKLNSDSAKRLGKNGKAKR